MNLPITKSHDLSEDRFAMLENLLSKHGICTDCGELFTHDGEEPFAYCGCGSTEWTGDFTPHMKIDLHNRTMLKDLEALEKEKVEETAPDAGKEYDCPHCSFKRTVKPHIIIYTCPGCGHSFGGV